MPEPGPAIAELDEEQNPEGRGVGERVSRTRRLSRVRRGRREEDGGEDVQRIHPSSARDDEHGDGGHERRTHDRARGPGNLRIRNDGRACIPRPRARTWFQRARHERNEGGDDTDVHPADRQHVREPEAAHTVRERTTEPGPIT